jgi:serine/threonine protein kinase
VLKEPVEFGKYVLLEEIGVGGMARVYRAVRAGPMGFRKEVAIKQILPQVAQEKKQIKALINEARLGGFLHHRNIVETYEFDRVGTIYYISMEFVDGYSLEQLLRRIPIQGRIPPRVVAQIAIQICDGLDHAHTADDDADMPLQLVHRDLKPANLMVTHKGVVKIMDFGVARAQTNLFRTQTVGMTKGTPAYMSPEQTTGESTDPLDARSDLFSLGSLTAELITGNVSFQGNKLYEVLRKIADGETRPVFKAVDKQAPQLAAVLRKAMQLHPADRYQSAAEMGQAIREIYPQLRGDEQLGPWLTEWMKGEGPSDPSPVSDSEIALASPWGHVSLELESLGPMESDQITAAQPPQRRWGLFAAIVIPLVLVAAIGLGVGSAWLAGAFSQPASLPPEPDASAEIEVSDEAGGEPVEDPLVAAADDDASAAESGDASADGQSGDTADAVVELRPAIIFSSSPGGADVYMGSSRLGRTSYRFEQGTPGRTYIATLRKDGYVSAEVSGRFPESGITTARAELLPSGGEEPTPELPAAGNPDLPTAAEVVTPATVQFIVGSNAAVQACFAQEEAGGGTLPARVWVRFEVQPGGAVQRARLVTEGLSGSQLESCVSREMGGLRFPPFAGSEPRSARHAFTP